MIWKGWNVILCGKIGFTMLVIWKYTLEVKYMLTGKSCSQQQKSFGTILMASHCPSIHCLLINWTIGNKIQWNMNQNNNWKFHMEMSSAKSWPFQTSFSFPSLLPHLFPRVSIVLIPVSCSRKVLCIETSVFPLLTPYRVVWWLYWGHHRGHPTPVHLASQWKDIVIIVSIVPWFPYIGTDSLYVKISKKLQLKRMWNTL